MDAHLAQSASYKAHANFLLEPCPECGGFPKWRPKGEGDYRCLQCDPPSLLDKKSPPDDEV